MTAAPQPWEGDSSIVTVAELMRQSLSENSDGLWQDQYRL